MAPGKFLTKNKGSEEKNMEEIARVAGVLENPILDT